jgi:hypothetical protein
LPRVRRKKESKTLKNKIQNQGRLYSIIIIIIISSSSSSGGGGGGGGQSS